MYATFLCVCNIDTGGPWCVMCVVVLLPGQPAEGAAALSLEEDLQLCSVTLVQP